MRGSFLAGIALVFGMTIAAHGWALGLDPAFHGPLLGPHRAKGVFVWSHGRSVTDEDWKSPNPPYLDFLRRAGWDVLRFDRLRERDTLGASSRRLAAYTHELKQKGYRRIVLAGQSFGAFLALMAADASSDVNAVVATAPAAYGSFSDFYSSWRLNATRLYPLIEGVKRARVMLFFFHGDDFDPGGRGTRSRDILARRGLAYAVIDQPAFFVGHWSASTGSFLRRFGSCIRDFITNDALKDAFVCSPAWGNAPSADLVLPKELRRPRRAAAAVLTATGNSGRGKNASAAAAVRKAWYGFYPNGREVLLAVERIRGHKLTAVYAVGPGLGRNEPAAWARRRGRTDGHELIFAARGKSTLRFSPRENGGLAATWISRNGEKTMSAEMRPIDPSILLRRAASGRTQPQ